MAFSTCLPNAFLAYIQKTLTPQQISTNSYILDRHGKDESFHPSSPPAAVLMPETEEEVKSIVALCQNHGVPIVPFGAGTSLEGHILSSSTGVTLSLEKVSMNQKY